MDGETPSFASEGDVWITFEDGEGDELFLEGLGEDQAGDASTDY